MPARDLRTLAETIARGEAEEVRARVDARLREQGNAVPDDVVDMGALLECAYPALASGAQARAEDLAPLVRGGTKLARDLRSYKKLALATIGGLHDGDGVRRG